MRENRDQRNRNHAEEHHETLEEVGPAHGEEAACERIRDNDDCADRERYQIWDAENGREQLCAGNEAGRGVEQEEYQNEYRRNDRDPAGFVMEAVLEYSGSVIASPATLVYWRSGLATSSQLR